MKKIEKLLESIERDIDSRLSLFDVGDSENDKIKSVILSLYPQYNILRDETSDNFNLNITLTWGEDLGAKSTKYIIFKILEILISTKGTPKDISISLNDVVNNGVIEGIKVSVSNRQEEEK